MSTNRKPDPSCFNHFSLRKIENFDRVALGDRSAEVMSQFMKELLHTSDMPEIAAFPDPGAGLDTASKHEPAGKFLEQPQPLGPDPALYVADRDRLRRMHVRVAQPPVFNAAV